jgi:Flp pilus assembly protein TadD
LILFRADHDRNAGAALDDARQEFRDRKDIYGADALSWAALKAGQPSEALPAARDALKFGTQDPRLLYHAGMVHLANGQSGEGRRLLRQALKLSPQFDPVHAELARKSLEAP